MEGITATVLPTVMRDEGFRAHLYLDGNGKATIGFGTCLEEGLDEDEAMYLLEHRLNKSVLACRNTFPWFVKLDAVRQGVIAQMVYQMGVAGVARFHETLRCIQAAIAAPSEELRATFFNAAAHQMTESKWGKHDSPARAARRAQEMRTGKLARG